MQNVDNFSSKMNDLKNSLNVKSKKDKFLEWPPCFISYCWGNSLMATKKGTKLNNKSIGKTDPRLLKDKLEQAGVKCWMDIEQVSQGGLFQDIAEGLKKAQIVVACVSDEYIASKNCQMEFRFAALTLRLPIILAIVGTGNNWLKSEIGMISLQYPRFDLQKSDQEVDELIDHIKDHIKGNETENDCTDARAETTIAINHEELSELLELAERKLLRQLTILQGLSKAQNFPHVPVLDVLPDSNGRPSKKYRFVFLCEYEQVNFIYFS